MRKRNFIYVISYVVIFALLNYLFISTLMDSTMQFTFPNSQFIMIFILMITSSLVIGLLVKSFINKTANGNKVLRTNLTMLFVIGTVISIMFLLGSFTLV
ncbi:hypothetical protein BIV60_00330 [Bacillus sp. MUM 116]|uniref:hypothetical protein n=1 Tax=Bacillus sp. MUM 116 TaxID=1678002 RepID=UPI0008F57A11|nr:hypothetical protein [Bacillus sp. MUM 116]OIK17175.1 hypothetical protein BIV60_00330 [Bacillus sp. MUM 116]